MEEQADKHGIEHWAERGFEGKGLKYPGKPYLDGKATCWNRDRFVLERYLPEDNESEGKVSTSSFLLFQSKLYSSLTTSETNTNAQ